MDNPSLLQILLAVLIMGFLMVLYYLSLKNLEKYAPERYKTALAISRHPLFTRGEVKFFVDDFTAILYEALAFTQPQICLTTIFFSKRSLQSEFFDCIVAHELGHLQFCHVGGNYLLEEMEADRFGAGIVGKERMRQFRLYSGYPPEHPFIKNLE